MERQPMTEDFEFGQYVHALTSSSHRIRYLIFAVAITTVVVFVAYRHGNPYGWTMSRVRLLRQVLVADIWDSHGKLKRSKDLAECALEVQATAPKWPLMMGNREKEIAAISARHGFQGANCWQLDYVVSKLGLIRVGSGHHRGSRWAHLPDRRRLRAARDAGRQGFDDRWNAHRQQTAVQALAASRSGCDAGCPVRCRLRLPSLLEDPAQRLRRGVRAHGSLAHGALLVSCRACGRRQLPLHAGAPSRLRPRTFPLLDGNVVPSPEGRPDRPEGRAVRPPRARMVPEVVRETA